MFVPGFSKLTSTRLMFFTTLSRSTRSLKPSWTKSLHLMFAVTSSVRGVGDAYAAPFGEVVAPLFIAGNIEKDSCVGMAVAFSFALLTFLT